MGKPDKKTLTTQIITDTALGSFLNYMPNPDDIVSELRKQLYKTALSAGLSIISGDKCCRILAWLYVYGGANEQTVFNEKLRNTIFYAQKRLNINGGEVPDIELTPVMQNYIKSVTDYNNPPEWIAELEKEYGLKPNREGKK